MSAPAVGSKSRKPCSVAVTIALGYDEHATTNCHHLVELKGTRSKANRITNFRLIVTNDNRDVS